MLHRERISSIPTAQFESCWDLYISAFPAEERRSLDYQIETMERACYHFDAIMDQSEVIGFLGWWDLDDMRYIEHFATSPSVRGKGYGREALENFIAEDSLAIILEVEPPMDELTRRRIAFYERIGLILNDHPYSHPSYRQLSDERVTLRIMSYPEAVTDDVMQRFNNHYIPQIHFRNFLIR